MSKFTKEQRDEIITLKLQGTKAKEIMQKFNVSRAYIYKMLKENDIDCKSEVQTNIDITEINEIESEDIFNDLNETYPETPKTMEIEPEPEPEPEIEPQIRKPFLSSINLESSSRVNNYVSPEKLDTLKILNNYDEAKTKTQTQTNQTRQQIKINKDPTLSDDYPDVQNTMNVIRRYIETYYDTGKLDDIVGNDKRTFVLRLNELDLYQLKVLLSNIQFKLSSSNTSKLFESGFFLISSQVESTACYLNYDLSGLTQALRHNSEVAECLKE